jgi:hypothetical protein
MKTKYINTAKGFSFDIINGIGILKEKRKTAIGNLSLKYRITLPKEEVERKDVLNGTWRVHLEKID